MASSSDGYCTIVRFGDGELGVPLTNTELPIGARKVAPTTNIDVSPPAMDTAVGMLSSNQTTPHRESVQVASTGTDGSNRRPGGPRRVQLITLSTTPKGVATVTTPSDTTSNTLVSTTESSVIIL